MAAGHSVGQAEALAAQCPCCQQAPSTAIDIFALASARLYDEITFNDDQPFKQRLAAVAHDWACHVSAPWFDHVGGGFDDPPEGAVSAFAVDAAPLVPALFFRHAEANEPAEFLGGLFRWRIFVLLVLGGQGLGQCPYGAFEFGQVVVDGGLQDHMVGVEVAVSQVIAHARDLGPGGCRAGN